MVEIHAEILHRSVFIPEEVIQCQVTVHNRNKEKISSDGNANVSCSYLDNLAKDGSTTVAWASAQISCQCYVNEKKIILPLAKGMLSKI